jgi:phosphomannomutase
VLEPQIFKSNDIRGVAWGPGAEWDAAGAHALGRAFARAFGLSGKRYAIGRDMRRLGPELCRAFAAGAAAEGASALGVGLVSTDQLWFVSGATGLPGVQFTASHNPGEYNGVKFCLPGAAPITPELMAAVKDGALECDADGCRWQAGASADDRGEADPPFAEEWDSLPDYAAKLHSLVDLDGLRRLKVVVDAGNGMAGLTTPAVLETLPIDVVGLYTDLDGTFPNHPANPLDPANLVDAQEAVRRHRADLGLVFDGDADRCFIVDEAGEVVNPALVTALIAERALAREPGASVVVNTITSRAVREVVEANGGRVVVSPVGHTHIKAAMAAHNAVFGGEHSAHYYFREFWYADTGMLAALNVVSLLGRGAGPMSQLVARLPHYPQSGEINSRVADAACVKAQIAQAFDGDVSWDDGVLVSGEGWWLSVRESNTEPLLRLNVEADDTATMEALRDKALSIIREGE